MESPTAKRRLVLVLVVAAILAAILAAFWYFRVCCQPLPRVPVSTPAISVPEGVRIKVEVLNSTTVRGLARHATMVLRDAGFDVVRYATDDTRGDSTRVFARSGRIDWAQSVAKALGGGVVEARPDSSRYLDVTVVIGADWRPPAKPFYP